MPAPITFGLVHGGFHCAAHWSYLIPELERNGHRAVAMDLPIEDETAGCAEYAQYVVDSLAGVTGPLVLVGHSLGGLTIPLVALRRAVAQLVFLHAIIPVPGKSRNQQLAEEPEMLVAPRAAEMTRAEAAIPRLYFDMPSDLQRWAVGLLRRQAQKPFVEITPLKVWPDVPRAYILGTADRAINPAWSRRAAAERLGVTPIELEDCGHSSFLSRPAELAEVLSRLAGSLSA